LKNFKIVNRRRAVGYDESHDKWTLAGFKTPLYIHQVTGAAFVLGREKNTMERIIECDGEDRLPKKGGKIDEDISENGHAKLMPNPTGGMILDLMGLGKTVTILAAITSAKRSKLPRSTLIVVPKALREQWWHEIKKHCDIDQVESCIRFDVWNRTIENAKTKGAKLYKSFLVLATYNEVIRYNLQKPSKSWWWYRVVLDEAHCIKNHLSLTAKLMVEIKAENRWLMTGTPLLNTKDELFSYFRFLKIDSMTNIRNFHKYFDLATEIGQQRMDTVLSKISIQRDYATTILGRKVVRMPSKTEYIHFVGRQNLSTRN
jgi:SNF2 family DNA or RNA helicase